MKRSRRHLTGAPLALLALALALAGCAPEAAPDPTREADTAAALRERVALARETARTFREHGELVRAAVELGRATGLDPRDAAAQRELGEVWLALGRPDAAEAAFATSLALDESAGALVGLGRCAIRNGRYVDALERLQRALVLDPSSYRARQQLGIALAFLDRSSEALAAFRAALELRPDDLDARHNVGYGQRIAGDAEGAIATLEAVLADDPTRAITLYELAQAYEAAGRIEDAKSTLRRLLEGMPGHASARRALERLGG